MAKPKITIVLRPTDEQAGKDRVVRFCQSIRIVEERDVDGTVVRVVKTILTTAHDGPVGGAELAEAAGLKRVTMLHHLRRLEELGLVARQGHKYMLRPSCMEELLEQMHRDTLAMLEDARQMARQIDSDYKLRPRRLASEGKEYR